MKRKLVKQGSATMMVSLPATWIKENKLGKGSEIFLDVQKNDLLIRSSSDDSSKKIIIDVTDYAPLVNRLLITAYVKGYDEIELISTDSASMKEIKKHVIEELLGLEIIKQSKQTMILQDITTGSTEDIDKIIKRLFTMLDSMAEELLTAKKKEDYTLVIDIDSGINKFVHFCLRSLNKKGYKEQEKTTALYGIIERLELIGDTYKTIARLQQKNERVTKKQTETIRRLKENLKRFETILFEYRKKGAITLAKEYETIKKHITNKGPIDVHLTQINETIIRMNNNLLITAI